MTVVSGDEKEEFCNNLSEITQYAEFVSYQVSIHNSLSPEQLLHGYMHHKTDTRVVEFTV